MEKFQGMCVIRVRIRNKLEYEKFRKYVLKTSWSYELDHPLFEALAMEFTSAKDLHKVTEKIVELLQLGFDVQTCRYKLERTLAEEEYPREEDDELYYDRDWLIEHFIRN